jgi:beta-fructofuranosidase
MRPPKELELLRYDAKTMAKLTVKADADVPLKGIAGKSIELAIEMVPGKGAKQFGVKVCCSPNGTEQTLVYYDAADRKLKVDTRKSGRQGPKKIEAGPFALKAGEPLKLRVFVDKSVVEVFANDRQAVTRRIYPSKDSVGVVLFASGGPVKVPTLQAWEMMPSNPY